MALRWVEVRLVGSHSDRGGGVVGRQVQLALCGHCDQALRVHLKMVEMVIMVVTAMVIRLSMFIIVTKVTVTRLSEFTSKKLFHVLDYELLNY